ncbi:hypothetical protein GSI_01515 [Ganoderma sinense ZZ0214-1]|uniref:Rad21/Rec8-like protein C-terminal eukaryotic domain-containing protein n=1 Tax=Ganoderma sinense ZZ0214-1 TaxID=1077348 RepID=A0A2G8SQ07_9APHY|nr:hypothetical protein GSI_01515 [Ganoderma sinense ZZ0214-1]
MRHLRAFPRASGHVHVPVTGLSTTSWRGASPEIPSSKTRCLDEDIVDGEEVEQERRDSRTPSIALGRDVYGRTSMGPVAGFQFDTTSAGVEHFQMEIPEPPPPDPFLEEGGESHADVTCPIALFDDRTVASQSQTQVIQRELQPNAEEPEEDKYMSFNNMAQKASRRAAAAAFFELLVLRTRDCIKLELLGAPAPWIDDPFVDEWFPAYVPDPVRWAVEAIGICCAFDCVCDRFKLQRQSM